MNIHASLTERLATYEEPKDAPAKIPNVGGYAPQLSTAAMSLWREVVTIPTVSSAQFLDTATNRVKLVLETKDIENNAKVAYEQVITAGSTELYPPVPVQKPNASFLAPSGNKSVRFVAMGADNDYKVEIWGRGRLITTISLKKVCKAPLFDTFFQNISWNEDETAFVFVAERPPSVTGKFWDEPKDGQAGAFERRETWGELYGDYSAMTLVYCDLRTKTAKNILSDTFTQLKSAAMPVLVNEEDVVFCAYAHTPRRLGIAHCGARVNTMHTVKVGDKNVPSAPVQHGFNNARNLRFFRETGKIAFFSVAPDCAAHLTCFSLNIMDAATAFTATPKVETIVPIVELPDSVEGFPGLYPCSGNDLFWVDSNTVLVNTVWRSAAVVVKVTLDTKAVARLPFCAAQQLQTPWAPTGTWKIMTFKDGKAIVLHSAVVNLPTVNIFDVAAETLTPVYNGAEDTTDGTSFASSLAGVKLISSIYSVPDAHDTEVLLHQADDGKTGLDRPTIIFMHGGPHSTDTNMFTHQLLFFILGGYNVASVNYGGSLGFGQKRIAELLGQIGTNDVQDCMAAVKYLVDAKKINAEKLFASGGSHGGFLTAQLTAQYPTSFVAAAMRNPVTCLSSVVYESDIPDWACAECGLDAPHAAAMFKFSPARLANEVRTPTIIGIGLGDLRVPPPQGISWFHAINASPHQPFNVRLMEYAGVGHSLDSVHAEADFAVHTLLFFGAESPKPVA